MTARTATPHTHPARIIIGMTGSIACYKSCELIRLLTDKANPHQIDVRVVMTPAATEFITPLTLTALSANSVSIDLLDTSAEAAMGHIELARWADLIMIAPASANTLAKLAQGFADNLLTTLCLASRAPVMVAPAMNTFMWEKAATQTNMAQLKSHGFIISGPDQGEQACGDQGSGRMCEPLTLYKHILKQINPSFKNQDSLISSTDISEVHQPRQHWLITAGPTQEPLDPVRYLSNYSSGKMGFALAEAAAHLLAMQNPMSKVTLICGPCSQTVLATNIQRIDVITANEMFTATQNLLKTDCITVFIGAAAVCDYRPRQKNEHKIKKTQDVNTLQLELVKNRDILAMTAKHPKRPRQVIGFAAETQQSLKNAADKLHKKKCDLILVNEVSSSNPVFGSDYNLITMLEANQQTTLPRQSKTKLAEIICRHIASKLVTT